MTRLLFYGLLVASTYFLSACSEQMPKDSSSEITDTISINLPPSLQANGDISTFTMLSENAGPTTISIAPNGDIWYTLSAANAIGRMSPDGSGMVEFQIPTPNSSPRIISLGADGNMWFSEHEGNKMGRITPSGEITEFPLLSENSQPRAIALGSDGNIWIGMFAASKIGRITPQGEITEFPLPRPNTGPGDITAGADGNMWFLELNGNMDNTPVDGNRVARITMSGDITEFMIPSEGSTPINIAVGPDRNIWYTKNNTLGRVTPAGQITEFSFADGPARALGLSAGSDRQTPDRLIDKLWFTDPANNRVGYLNYE